MSLNLLVKISIINWDEVKVGGALWGPNKDEYTPTLLQSNQLFPYI